MSRSGLGALLAIAFLAATPLLLESADGPLVLDATPVPTAVPATDEASPGLLDRARLKACEVSLATTRRDLRSHRDRSQECERRQGIRT